MLSLQLLKFPTRVPTICSVTHQAWALDQLAVYYAFMTTQWSLECSLCVAVMIFHVANAWQEGKDKDIIKLFACCFEEVLHISTIPCDAMSQHAHTPEETAMACMCWLPFPGVLLEPRVVDHWGKEWPGKHLAAPAPLCLHPLGPSMGFSICSVLYSSTLSWCRVPHEMLCMLSMLWRQGLMWTVDGSGIIGCPADAR